MTGHAAWIASLSPWPEDGFGLERIRAVLAELGDPQLAYPSIHVVGTNGKSTATRQIEAMLAAAGLKVGAYLSPHVTGWSERIRIGGEEADFEAVVARVRAACERHGATQFEALTAAALAAFADAGVDAAAVEAGLGGRYDATNVLDAPVVLLTNVALEHADVLGSTREAIAREKLAVARPGATVVLGEPEWASLVPDNEVVVGGAREAAAAFVGHPVEPVDVQLPGRFERRGNELWDGAHNPDGVRWLVEHAPKVDVIVCSILADKDAEAMLAGLSALASRLVATQSSSPRVLPAEELARRAAPYFAEVEAVADAAAALARAHELGDSVLVTGSLYLLADLSSVRPRDLPWPSLATG